jgi:hypothetical protein
MSDGTFQFKFRRLVGGEMDDTSIRLFPQTIGAMNAGVLACMVLKETKDERLDRLLELGSAKCRLGILLLKNNRQLSRIDRAALAIVLEDVERQHPELWGKDD